VAEFEPGGLDVPGWVSAAKSFGARYLVLAVNHCGGALPGLKLYA
jgi:alpha-L-fucosidase